MYFDGYTVNNVVLATSISSIKRRLSSFLLNFGSEHFLHN